MICIENANRCSVMCASSGGPIFGNQARLVATPVTVVPMPMAQVAVSDVERAAYADVVEIEEMRGAMRVLGASERLADAIINKLYDAYVESRHAVELMSDDQVRSMFGAQAGLFNVASRAQFIMRTLTAEHIV